VRYLGIRQLFEASIKEHPTTHAPFEVVRRAIWDRPRLQPSVFQRHWPCILASLLIVVSIEMFAGACRAMRCAEPSVRRSFSR